MELLHRRNIVETADMDGNFSTLVSALRASGLDETLEGKGPYTLFAPADTAFAKLPEGTVSSLLDDKDRLIEILSFHVIGDRLSSKDLSRVTKLTTLSDREVSVRLSYGLFVGGAKVIGPDIKARNGVIHAIDSVLLPG